MVALRFFYRLVALLQPSLDRVNLVVALVLDQVLIIGPLWLDRRWIWHGQFCVDVLLFLRGFDLVRLAGERFGKVDLVCITGHVVVSRRLGLPFRALAAEEPTLLVLFQFTGPLTLFFTVLISRRPELHFHDGLLALIRR